MSNANTYLDRFDQGLNFAKKSYLYASDQCRSLKKKLDECSNETARPQMEEKLTNHTNLRVMSVHAKATIHQKKGALQRALAEFKAGKHIVEKEFSDKH